MTDEPIKQNTTSRKRVAQSIVEDRMKTSKFSAESLVEKWRIASNANLAIIAQG
jgi:hypothetical protein